MPEASPWKKRPTPTDESFLLLFFKKEALPCLIPACTAGAFALHLKAAAAGLNSQNDDEALVPIASRPDLLWIVVAGGDGRHSTYMPAWNVCEGATQLVER